MRLLLGGLMSTMHGEWREALCHMLIHCRSGRTLGFVGQTVVVVVVELGVRGGTLEGKGFEM